MYINVRARCEAVSPASRMPNSYSPLGVMKNSKYVIEIPGMETSPVVCLNRGLFKTSAFVGISLLVLMDCKDV
jgi:hypothetical protein